MLDNFITIVLSYQKEDKKITSAAFLDPKLINLKLFIFTHKTYNDKNTQKTNIQIQKLQINIVSLINFI